MKFVLMTRKEHYFLAGYAQKTSDSFTIGWLLVAFFERFVTSYHFTVESFIFTNDLEKAGTLFAVAGKD